MEMVWSMSNPLSLSFEEEIALAKEYSEYISLELDKVLKFLERENIYSIDNILKSNNLKPLIILHDSKLGEKYNEKDFQKIYDISKELNIPYFLVNPAEKPGNLSSIVAIDVFNRNLKKLLNFVEI
ncbi:MAG TPA: sugar phosphate isomerase/epimerase, partial [Dictyoglomaceae bacterium]|nr:sugar phosphate isomerase/epimerase [Dictyoglomaceae bacterium]